MLPSNVMAGSSSQRKFLSRLCFRYSNPMLISCRPRVNRTVSAMVYAFGFVTMASVTDALNAPVTLRLKFLYGVSVTTFRMPRSEYPVFHTGVPTSSRRVKENCAWLIRVGLKIWVSVTSRLWLGVARVPFVANTSGVSYAGSK